MKEPLEPALARLDQLAKRLNEQTDRINQQIASLNERLGGMKLGVSVWDEEGRAPFVLNDGGNGTTFSIGTQLGYAKAKGSWQLAVRAISVKVHFFEGDESQAWHEVTPNGDPEPLLDAPRIIRVEACTRLHSLLNALISKVEHFLEGLDSTTSQPLPLVFE